MTGSASHRHFLLDFTTSRLESILFGVAPGHERQYSSSGVPSTGLLGELDNVSLVIELQEDCATRSIHDRDGE